MKQRTQISWWGAVITKLYKYCSFSVYALKAITDSEVHYSDPRKFNDPMDCSPTIDIDMETSELERLTLRILEERHDYNRADFTISDYRYYVSQFGSYNSVGSEAYNLYRDMLAVNLDDFVREEFSKLGVLSLSESWDSALMWSHYADEHRGICIEYDLSDNSHPELKPITYEASRSYRSSDVWNWVCGEDTNAKLRIKDKYFYTKSPEWKYENEWRDIAKKSGSNDAPFSISAIYFGYRCDQSVITSIVKLLSGKKEILLKRVKPKSNSFILTSSVIDRGEIENNGIRTPGYKLIRYFDDLDL